jgi:hypothetical protein
MKTTATNRKIRVLITDVRDLKLIPRPEFQRRLVWTDKDKRSFLSTVLDGYPFPEIYIAAGDVNSETGEGKELLVDGQQRITTLFQYFNGSKELIHGDLTPYMKLSEEEKQEFLNYDVVVRDLGTKTLDEIKDIFRRINSTKYTLNAMEINNARYDGEFKQFCDGISRHSFFETNRVFSATEIRRMLDVQFCLLLAVTLMSSYLRRNERLEEFLAAYNDEFAERSTLHKEMETVFNFVTACCFDQKSRVWAKADLFTLLVEVHKLICKKGEILNPELVGRRLQDFYTKVDKVHETKDSSELVTKYAHLSRHSINDRNNRIERGIIINSIIEDNFVC